MTINIGSTRSYGDRMLNAARFAVCVTAATLPFSTAATNIFLGLAVVAWLVSGRVRSQLGIAASNPVAVGGAFVICLLWVGAIWSEATLGTVADVIGKYRKLLALVVLVALLDSNRWRLAVLASFFASVVLLLSVSFGTFLGWTGLAPDPSQGAIVIKNHITHGFLMALLALAAGVWSSDPSRTALQRWVAGVILLAALSNLFVMTNGRTAYLVVGALVAWIALKKLGWRALLLAPAAIGAVGSLLYFVSPAVHLRVDDARRDLQLAATGNFDTSVGLRLYFNQTAWKILRDHPVVGAGTGSWHLEFDRYSRDANPAVREFGLSASNPHSDYAMTAAQFGAAGVLLFATALIGLYRMGRRLPRNQRLLLQGLLVAYASAATVNSVMLDFTEGHVLVILLAALLGGRWPRANSG